MVLRMASPARRNGSTLLQLRQRIPRDVLDKARGTVVNVPIGDRVVSRRLTPNAETVVMSLGTRDPREAKARQAVALVYLEGLWDSLRSGPQRLTQKQIVALAGELYRAFAETLEDNPGSTERWQEVLAANRAAARGEYGRGPLYIGVDQSDRVAASLEDRFGGLVDVVLARRGLVVDLDSRERLLAEAGKALNEAAEKLARNADGDYRPDATADRFPVWTDTAQPQSAGAVSLNSLFEGWWSEAKAGGTSPRTHEGYQRTIRQLAAFLGHDDARRVTPEDVIRFKDHRLAAGKSPKTVKDSDLAALKSVFGWAVVNRKLPTNPAAGITLKVGKRAKLRPSGFTDDEAKAILSASLAYRGGPNELPQTRTAKRWVPWLCAYTGARVGEIAQLRKQDVRCEGEHWVLTLTPEAGTVKDKVARDVPLHPHLVEQGFPEFVQNAPDGHLFVRVRRGVDVVDTLQGVKNRPAEFARQFVPDPRVQPNHGWRHRFKTVGMEAGADSRVLDEICGHAPQTVGGGYGGATVKTKAAAIARMPRYAVA